MAGAGEVDRGRLLRLLGVAFAVAVTVGGTIGVGILRTPGMVARQLGDPWLIAAAWLLGGGYSLAGTLSVVELGTALPAAGGWYVYARRAFGEGVGFVVGWCDWLAQCASLAYLAVSIADFAVSLAPVLTPATKLVALSPLAAFALIQWLGLRESSWTQQATSLVKAVALLAFVAICFAHGPEAAAAAAPSVAAPAGGLALLTLFGAVIALQSVVVTYDGWYSAIYFTEEDEDPGRNLPRGALGGVLATIVIYMLVNLALMRVLSVQELAASGLPAADVAQAVFGGAGGPIVTALALVSLLSVVNAVLMLATRIAFAIARDARQGSLATRVSPSGTPVPAMLLTTGASMALVLSGSFEQLIAITAILLVVIYASGFIALLVLRQREPALPRPFRVPGYPWVPLLALLGSLGFLAGNVVSDPRSSAWAAGLVALSYPVFRLLAARGGPNPRGILASHDDE